MQRRWVLVVGALLVLLALFLLGEAPPKNATEDDALNELLRASGEAGAPTGGRGETPILTGAGAGDPGEPARGPDGKADSASAPQAGPADFLVVSHETAAPLEKVALQDGEGTVLALTDEEGLARIESVPGRGLVLRVVRKGYVQTVVRARPGDLTEIALRPGIRVLGRIVRVGTRGDAGVAEVSVWDEDLGSEIASFTTDESGAFEIGAVRPNRPFLMTVRLAGLVPQVKRIVLDVPTNDLEVLVGAGGHLTGRVHTDADVPLPGLEVRLLRAYEPILEQRGWREGETRADLAHIAARVASTHTDEDGRYVFHGIPVTQKFQPVVLVRGRHVARGQSVAFDDLGQTLERDILAPAGARLRIRIVDGSGQAIGDADMEIHSAGAVWHVRSSDERTDGAILLRDLTPGPFDLTIKQSGAPTLHEQGVLVSGEEAAVNVAVARGLELLGKVQDKHGAPVWKALVHWSSGEERVEVRTEMDGRFRFRNLTGSLGTVLVSARDLSVSAFGYEDRTVPDVQAGGPALQVTLKNGPRVRGSFHDLPPRAQVHSSMVPGTRYDDARLALDEEFGFVRRGPLPGKTALFVFRTRGRPPILRPEDTPFQSEEVRDLGPLFFEALNPRRGRILGKEGLPLWATKVTLEEPWSQVSVRTDRKGDFVLPHMPRRNLAILVEAEGYPTTPLTLGTGSEFKVQVIHLRMFVQVSVQIVASDPVNRHKTKVVFERIPTGKRDSKTSAKTWFTDRLGRLRVLIAPGRYLITATARKSGASTNLRTDLTNEPQQTLQLELR